MLSFFLFLKWLLFLDLLIFIIQFCFISVPKLVLPEPAIHANSSCSATQNLDYTSGKGAGNLVVDFMTGQVSSTLIMGCRWRSGWFACASRVHFLGRVVQSWVSLTLG